MATGVAVGARRALRVVAHALVVVGAAEQVDGAVAVAGAGRATAARAGTHGGHGEEDEGAA